MTSKIKTFFDEVGKWFKKLFGSTTWEKQVSAAIGYIAPGLELIIGLVAGSAAEAAVQLVITQIQNGLATLATIVSGAVSAPSANSYQAAVAALNSIKANFASLLSLAEIKDSATQEKLTEIVNPLIAEVDAMLENLPSLATSAPTPAPAAG
jgi:hypothetical protein